MLLVYLSPNNRNRSDENEQDFFQRPKNQTPSLCISGHALDKVEANVT